MEKEFFIIDYSDSEIETIVDDASMDTIESDDSDFEYTKNEDDNVDTKKFEFTFVHYQQPQQKTYKCGQIGCRREFSSRSMFQHHRKMHLREKRYLCSEPKCGKRFYRKDKLLDRSRHIHNPMKAACTCAAGRK